MTVSENEIQDGHDLEPKRKWKAVPSNEVREKSLKLRHSSSGREGLSLSRGGALLLVLESIAQGPL